MKFYGYPAGICKNAPGGENQPCAGKMYRDIGQFNESCPIADSSATELMYTCDTQGGMSGAALWRSQNNCAYGTHNWWLIDDSGNYNRAHRFNSSWVSWMKTNVICASPSVYASYPGC